jgi:hypothetical protein
MKKGRNRNEDREEQKRIKKETKAKKGRNRNEEREEHK